MPPVQGNDPNSPQDEVLRKLQHYSEDLKWRIPYQKYTRKKTNTQIVLDPDIPLLEQTLTKMNLRGTELVAITDNVADM